MKIFRYLWAMAKMRWYGFRGYDVVVTSFEHDQRLELCYHCPFLDAQAGECLKCGCPVEEKTLIASEECPKHFWRAVRRKTKHY